MQRTIWEISKVTFYIRYDPKERERSSHPQTVGYETSFQERCGNARLQVRVHAA